MAPHRAISLHGLPSVLTRPGLVTRLRALAAEAHSAAAPSSPRSPSNRRDGFVPIDWKVVDAGSERLELARNEFQATSALWVGPVPELTGEGVDTPLRRRLVSDNVVHKFYERNQAFAFGNVFWLGISCTCSEHLSTCVTLNQCVCSPSFKRCHSLTNAAYA